MPMFRYKLRTLMIVLGIGPPMLAGGYWEFERRREAAIWIGDESPNNGLIIRINAPLVHDCDLDR